MSSLRDLFKHYIIIIGPTALLHFAVPDKPGASPRNSLIGHLIGCVAGSVSLQVTFLYDNQVALIEGEYTFKVPLLQPS